MAKVTRGNNVFKRIGRTPEDRGFSPRGFGAPGVNDLFLYALFARIAMANNDNVEFETKYNKLTNTIELNIPSEVMPLLDKIMGIQQGPNFKRYIAWLVGNAGGGGGGGTGQVNWVTDTVTTFDNTPTVIAVIPIPDDTIYMIDARMTARRTDATGHGGFMRRAVVWREGGGPATLEGTTDFTFTRRSPQNRGGYDTTLDVSGNNAIITVTGKNGQVINWQSQYIFNVST